MRLLSAVLLLLMAAGASAQPATPVWAEARAVWLMADTTAVPAPPPRPVDPWLAPDKALHLGAGFLIALSTQFVLEGKLDVERDPAWMLSFGTATAAGLAKELYDSQRPHRPFFSWRDLVATSAGGALAVGLILL